MNSWAGILPFAGSPGLPLPVDDAFCRGDIIGEAGKRLLDGAHAVSAIGQDVMNASPSRAISRRTMHE
jgi:hypothetical protein